MAAASQSRLELGLEYLNQGDLKAAQQIWKRREMRLQTITEPSLAWRFTSSAQAITMLRRKVIKQR